MSQMTEQLEVGLTARFPLGIYRGHRADGTQESLPSFARVHAALLAAAATGSVSERGSDLRMLSQASRECLVWLEEHPPVALALPATRVMQVRGAAWRKEGVHLREGKGKGIKDKTVARAHSPGVAVADRIAWCWESMPPTIREQLDLIAADVAYLGESESTVVLQVEQGIEPTHRLDPEPSTFRPEGVPVLTPAEGRCAFLEGQFALANPAKRPTLSQDKANLSSRPKPVVTPKLVATMPRFYVSMTKPEPRGVPWNQVLMVPVAAGTPDPADNELVRVCALVHRTLVSRISSSAVSGAVPSAVTGKYLEGTLKSANHLAVQWIRRTAPGLQSQFAGTDHIAILVPAHSDAEILPIVQQAMAKTSRLYSRSVHIAIDGKNAKVVPADEFWQDAEPGFQRWWRPAPVAIPERAVGPKHATEAEHAELTLYWSLGNVFRDDEEIGDANVTNRVAALRDRGVTVASAAPVHTTQPLDYVYKTNRKSVVRPYTALVSLGDLVGGSTILAVGQSRHMGGGLLTPVDLPMNLRVQRS